MAEQTTQAPQFALEDDGTIIHNAKNGRRVILGRYDEEAKHLEFENKDISIKYRAQILRVVGTDGDGTTPSDRTIRSMGIKGESADVVANIPPRPKMNKLFGDATPEVVEWFFKYKPKEAYVRYGVKLDKKGEPVRGHCKRKSIQFVDNTNLDDSQLQAQRDGTHSEIKGPVFTEGTIEEYPNAIIASRSTHMTFLKEEQIGYDGNDDDEGEAMVERGGDE